MSITKDMVRKLLRQEGIHATEQEVETTLKLHNALDEQMGRASAESLAAAEPHYIQPTRAQPKRR
jgi:hypothetical protein